MLVVRTGPRSVAAPPILHDAGEETKRPLLSFLQDRRSFFPGARMSIQAEQVIATFAAAIIITRGATSVDAIREAWSDARWILFPEPTDAEYQDWQRSHGEMPGTLQDAEAATAALAARRRHMSRAAQVYGTL